MDRSVRHSLRALGGRLVYGRSLADGLVVHPRAIPVSSDVFSRHMYSASPLRANISEVITPQRMPERTAVPTTLVAATIVSLPHCRSLPYLLDDSRPPQHLSGRRTLSNAYYSSLYVSVKVRLFWLFILSVTVFESSTTYCVLCPIELHLNFYYISSIFFLEHLSKTNLYRIHVFLAKTAQRQAGSRRAVSWTLI